MSSESKLKSRIRNELSKRLFSLEKSAVPIDRFPGYAQAPKQVLVGGFPFGEIEKDLKSGDGSELRERKAAPPKFQAAHSSALLAVNTFGPFRENPAKLRLLGEDRAKSLRFEKQCPTGLARSPNLDLLIDFPSRIIAIESKFLELFGSRRASFSDRYDPLVDQIAEEPWKAVFSLLKSSPKHYTRVDAAQLIKHYLGLRNTYSGRPTTLVYLYWEPENAADIEFYWEHEREARDLAARVAGSEITLSCMSYIDAWAELAAMEAPHIDRVRARYLFSV